MVRGEQIGGHGLEERGITSLGTSGPSMASIRVLGREFLPAFFLAHDLLYRGVGSETGNERDPNENLPNQL